MRLAFALALGFLLLASCMPRYVTPGPQITLPRLEADAVLTADGVRLALRKWEAASPQAVVIALHGFNDYGNAFRGVGGYLAEHGITTYAIDQRGFGDSPVRGRWPGTEALVGDLDTLVGLVRARHPTLPLYVLGESMGGAVALAWAARKGNGKADGLVLSAPAVWGWQALNPAYKSVLFLAAHIAPWAKVTGRNLDIWPSDNIEMLRAQAADPKVIKKTRIDAVYGLVTLMDHAYDEAKAVAARTLLLYGKHDQVIPAAPVRHVVAALGNGVRYVYYPNGYHMLLRDLQREVVWRDVLAFMNGDGLPLPSGNEQASHAGVGAAALP